MEHAYEREIEKSPRSDANDNYDPLKRYLSDIANHTILTREEEREIAEKAHRYKDRGASETLVTSNLRLVVKIALEYYNTYLNILDLVQEGNVGLVEAVKRFNPYKGTRFSTYAQFWIRAYIRKHIMDSRSIVKIGTTQAQRRLYYGLNREKRRIESTGTVASPELLADALGASTGEVEAMEGRLNHGDISLEQHMYGEGEETVMNTIASDENVEEAVAEREKETMIKERIALFKNSLNEKHRYILENRIMADEPQTLIEIGEKFGISRERVRQLQNRLLKKFEKAFEVELRDLGLK